MDKLQVQLDDLLEVMTTSIEKNHQHSMTTLNLIGELVKRVNEHNAQIHRLCDRVGELEGLSDVAKGIY